MTSGAPYKPISLPPMTGGRPRPFQVITCTECGTQGRKIAHRGQLPPQAIEKFFKGEGWQISRAEQGVCPACVKKSQAERRAKQALKNSERSNEMASKPTAPAAQPAPEKSPAVKASLAELYLALDEHFDVPAKRYRSGYSDKRIADILGLSEAFVRQRRETDFGPIAEDTFVQDVLAPLMQIKGMIRETASRLGEMEARVDRAVALVEAHAKTEGKSNV